MASSPTPNEVRFAYLLLQYIGANKDNMYLLLAVVGWLRAESGGDWSGWNPLHLYGYNPYAAGHLPRDRSGRDMVVFGSLNAAIRGTAWKLMNTAGLGYDAVLSSARRWNTATASQQTQAIDFMYALALSNWSQGHYGYGLHPDLSEMTQADLYNKNTLIAQWLRMLGSTVTIPKDLLPQPPAPPKPKAPPPPPPKPPVPKVYAQRVPSLLRQDYLEPYARYNWYVQRVREAPVLASVSLLERPVVD